LYIAGENGLILEFLNGYSPTNVIKMFMSRGGVMIRAYIRKVWRGSQKKIDL
jgi:hypothetical protein